MSTAPTLMKASPWFGYGAAPSTVTDAVKASATT